MRVQIHIRSALRVISIQFDLIGQTALFLKFYCHMIFRQRIIHLILDHLHDRLIPVMPDMYLICVRRPVGLFLFGHARFRAACHSAT